MDTKKAFSVFYFKLMSPPLKKQSSEYLCLYLSVYSILSMIYTYNYLHKNSYCDHRGTNLPWMNMILFQATGEIKSFP